MDPTTGMAALWGTLDLAGNTKSSGCDFMSLKQFLLNNMGPGFCCEGALFAMSPGRVWPSTPWDWSSAADEEFGLQLGELGAVPTGNVET